ncbi:dicarboxylate/amino acid:cation symporter [Sphingomonas sp. Leaf231]|uniref:dicarboxylate/amino acid:cation symporter n=1 Tax=Sphingomonas sp. Leaf231 TaxID=1736301 RepID=UPI003FA6D404
MLNTPPARILIGLVAGLAIGVWLTGTAHGEVAVRVAQPVGKLWLDALTMTVVPLVFALLVTGVMEAAREASGGKVAARAIGWFAILLIASTLLAAVTTTLVLRGVPLPPGAAALGEARGAGPVPLGDAHWLDNIIPTNPIRAAADTAMVPLVIFALLFGLGASGIEAEPRAALERVFRGIGQTMLRIVTWVLWIAPVGVFALAVGVGSRMGGAAAGVLAHYVFVVIAACLFATLLCYAAAALFGRISPLTFARAALPSQVIAVSTQSSLASLPAMISAAAPLRVMPATAGIVLPLAVSLFRAASAAANVAVAIYLAQVHAVPLGVTTLVGGAIVAAAVSVAAVGLPAQVSFFAIIAPVCIAMGVPVVLLPVLLAIETLPDIFRTLGNVTADLAVARIVGRVDGAADRA